MKPQFQMKDYVELDGLQWYFPSFLSPTPSPHAYFSLFLLLVLFLLFCSLIYSLPSQSARLDLGTDRLGFGYVFMFVTSFLPIFFFISLFSLLLFVFNVFLF